MHRGLSALPVRAARWSAAHPWRAIGLWLVLVTAAVALAATVPTEQATDADYRVGESGRAEAMVADAGLGRPSTETVLITTADAASGASSESLDQQAATRAAAELTAAMQDLDGVSEVGEPVAGADGEAMLVPIVLASDDVEVEPLLAATAEVDAAHPGLDLEQAGDASIGSAIDERVEDDLRSAELTSVPITLLLMLLAFGALIAAGIPVLLAATSVAATIGIIAPISHLVPAEPTVYSMVVLIGMAVGVDYSLFYLKRERQERAAGQTRRDAVAIAAETSGHAILVSGAAVIASLCGLFVLTDVTFNSLATGSIIVVAVAVLGSITVLPALLSRLGRWVDRPRVPLLWRLSQRTQRSGAVTVSSRLMAPVVRHPVIALLAAGIAIAALAIPAAAMKTHQADVETLPADIATVQTWQQVTEHFPGEGTTADVVVHDVPDPAALLSELAAEASAEGIVLADGADMRTSTDGSTAVVELTLPYEASDDRAGAAIERLREETIPTVLAGVDPSAWAVGGDAAESLDDTDRQAQRLPILLIFVLALTMLTMVLAFRSAVLGIVSTALNLVSVGVAFGVLTIVFQWGVGESLLDFTSPGFVIDWIPVFVLVVLVGLSMDYHVFVLSRIRELVDAGVPARDAVRRGVGDTAGVITSAAAVMVSVFAIFATLSMLEMKMMGVGLAAAILLDATVIRLVALPAILVLLGDRAWGRRKAGATPDADPAAEPTTWISDDGVLVPVRR